MVVSFVGSHSQKTKEKRSSLLFRRRKEKVTFFGAFASSSSSCCSFRNPKPLLAPPFFPSLPLSIYLAEQYWLGAEEEEERVLEASATGLTSAGGRKEEEGIKCQAKAREGRKRRMKVQNSSLPLPPLRLGWTFWPYIMTLVALAVLYGQAKVRLDSWLFCWWGKS